MNKIKYTKDLTKKRKATETKDRVEIIEEKNYFLFILFDGFEGDINSNRGISASLKFIKKNFLNFQNKSGYDLKGLVIGANKKILELNLTNTKTGIVILYYPKDEKENSKFVLVGSSAFYGISYNQLDRIFVKKNNKFLGEKINSEEILETKINNNKKPLFLCSDSFVELFAKNKKDIIKILNFKDPQSLNASLKRVMRTRDLNLSYIFVRRFS